MGEALMKTGIMMSEISLRAPVYLRPVYLMLSP